MLVFGSSSSWGRLNRNFFFGLLGGRASSSSDAIISLSFSVGDVDDFEELRVFFLERGLCVSLGESIVE